MATPSKKLAPKALDTFDKKLYELHKVTLAKAYGDIEEVDLIELRRFVDYHTRAARVACELRGRETVLYEGGYRPNPLLAVLEKYENILNGISRKLGLNLADRMSIIKAKRDQELKAENLKISKLKAETDARQVSNKSFNGGDDYEKNSLSPNTEGIELP